ncbi:MAG: NUDIX hydrolase [Halanaerobiaceae bacterium]|nr:NUDIX hydrolase [Halanaerobiaceae bacterium]
MEYEERTIASKEIYKGKIIKVRYDEVIIPAGKKSGREIVEHPGGVTIIAVTDDKKILLVEQYRKAPEENLLELPAGKLEEEEEPVICAERELLEETGYQAGKIEYLFSFYTTPGYSNELLHLYYATDLKGAEASPDEDEVISVHYLKKEDILLFINTGKIKDSKTIIGLLYYLAGDWDV